MIGRYSIKGIWALSMLIAPVMASAQGWLVDQTPGSIGTAVASQNFESSNSSYDCMAADDFIVPTGEQWHIDSVEVRGQYAVPSGNPTPGAGIIVHIYQDNNGSPGTLVFADTNLDNVDPQFTGVLKAKWSSPIVLSPGTYWIGIAARKDAGITSTQWEWFNSLVNQGDSAQWQNPQNGFNLGCTSYNPISVCLGNTNPGMSFAIYGCPQAPPEISGLIGGGVICSNEPLQLNPSANISNPQWSWNTGDTSSSIFVNQSGQYIVILTDPLTSCKTTDTSNIFANDPPETNLLNDTICEREIRTLSVPTCAGCAYQWSTGSSGASTTVSSEGWKFVTVFDAGTSCTSEDSAYIEVVEIDTIGLLPGAPAEWCGNDTVMLSLISTYESYLWSTGETTSTFQLTEPGTYGVTVSIDQCSEELEFLGIRFEAPTPTISNNLSEGQAELAVVENYSSYEWSNGSTSQSVTVSVPGPYSVEVTDSNGCMAKASYLYIPLGLSNPIGGEVEVFPIPAKGQLHVFNPQGEFLEYSMIDLQGREMMGGVVSGTNAILKLEGFAPGSYFINFRDNEAVTKKTILIE